MCSRQFAAHGLSVEFGPTRKITITIRKNLNFNIYLDGEICTSNERNGSATQVMLAQ
jgi:hypothetical protein